MYKSNSSREKSKSRRARGSQKLVYAFSLLVAALVFSGIYFVYGQYKIRRANEADIESYQEMMTKSEYSAFPEGIPIIECGHNEDGSPYYIYDDLRLDSRPDFFSQKELIYNGKRYRRNSVVKCYLLMGVDADEPLTAERPFDDRGLTDAIFVVAHNTSSDTVKILQVPRDSMVRLQMTDSEGKMTGIEIYHINYQWVYGDGQHLSGELSRQAVSWLLGGLPIQRYAAGGLKLTERLTDFIGGVEISFQDDEFKSYRPEYTRGSTAVLNGIDAEKFVRHRDMHMHFSAIRRMKRHRQFTIAFQNSLLKRQKEDPQTIPNMLKLIESDSISDMDKGSLLRLAMDLLKSGSLTNDSFTALPGKSVIGEEYDEYFLDEPGVDELILDSFFTEVLS